jgi:D-tyrosyl-tRNA(Tyr) deacylase
LVGEISVALTSAVRLTLKVFDDPLTGGMWKRSVKDVEGEILCVSQFTLMAKTIKGAKPDFHKVNLMGDVACLELTLRL